MHAHAVHLALGALLIPCTMCGTGFTYMWGRFCNDQDNGGNHWCTHHLHQSYSGKCPGSDPNFPHGPGRGVGCDGAPRLKIKDQHGSGVRHEGIHDTGGCSRACEARKCVYWMLDGGNCFSYMEGAFCDTGGWCGENLHAVSSGKCEQHVHHPHAHHPHHPHSPHSHHPHSPHSHDPHSHNPYDPTLPAGPGAGVYCDGAPRLKIKDQHGSGTRHTDVSDTGGCRDRCVARNCVYWMLDGGNCFTYMQGAY